ncbi:MAG: hypothetical protein L3J97_02965 [Thermoplasmata archaeon]|nr:hypothetical protein [Thermoplasmata archaeon]
MSASKQEAEWIHADVDILLDSGVRVRVEGVEAARDSESGAIYYDPASALSKYYLTKSREAGLEQPRDAALLSLLVAPIGGVDAAWVLRKYSLNKMLFYQWDRARVEGLGDAFPHDAFVAERKGPVPANIEADLTRLEAAGLVKITRHDPSIKQHQPWVIELTEDGKRSARAFFDSTETWFRRATIETKKRLLFLDPAQLRARVHTEHPEFRRKYVEVDSD